MALIIPDGIPDSTNLPDGRYDFKNEGGLEVMETQTGKLAIKVALRVTAPKAYKGTMHFEQFTIGTDVDRSAKDPETWLHSFGSVNCKKMCSKSGVPFVGAVEKVSRELDGQAVSGRVVYSVQPKFNKDGTENPYAGNARSQVKDWYTVGDAPAGVGDNGPRQAAPALAPKKAPKAPPPPDTDDDDDAEEVPAPPRGKRVAPAAAARPALADDDEDDD